MSWFNDPKLLVGMYSVNPPIFRIFPARNNLSVGTKLGSDITTPAYENYNFYKHFYSGNNKESDYEAFFSDLLKRPFTMINCQGIVATYDLVLKLWIVSREVPNSVFYSMPGIQPLPVEDGDKQKPEEEQADQQHKAEKEALEKKVSELETTIFSLKEQDKKLKAQVVEILEKLHREQALRKSDKQACEKKISELTSKLAECRGAGGGSSTDEGPWMTSHPVPSSWVPFDDLEIQMFRKDNHLTITKEMGVPIFAEDHTTNVQSNRFHRGVFPIVVVNVAELIPNMEDARFDPNIWSLCVNGGTSYAARKLFASEMLVDSPKTG